MREIKKQVRIRVMVREHRTERDRKRGKKSEREI